MQLSEIIEENSLRSVVEKTRIREEDIEHLMASNFEAITKVKTLGFISILEREYSVDLSELKAAAEAYYAENTEEHLYPTGQLLLSTDKSSSVIIVVVVVLLIAVSSWYFFTQFDKDHLNDIMPFMEEKASTQIEKGDEMNESNVATHLRIDTAVTATTQESE